MASCVRNVGLAGRVALLACACLLMMCGLAGTAVAQPYELEFTCEMPVGAPTEVREAFEKYHACTAPIFWEWFEKYPDEVARLEDMYVAWKAGRGHDLRAQKAAEKWLEKYPVRFDAGAVSSNSVATAASAKDMQTNAEDFFVYGENTAFTEDPATGAVRDLVVLDISNRARPKEVARVKSVLQRLYGSPGFVFRKSPQRPPSFGEYVHIREGQRLTPCGSIPRTRAAPYGWIFCRPDGSCYQDLKLKSVDDATCANVESRVKRWNLTEGRGLDYGFVRRSPCFQPGEAEREYIDRRVADNARMKSRTAAYGSTLYVLVNPANSPVLLMSFDVSMPAAPRVRHVLELRNSAESLLLHGNLLLIEGPRGITTVSLGVPDHPRLVGEYRQLCGMTLDSLVMQGSVGYRTIFSNSIQYDRGCTSCLEVIDFSQPHKPVLQATVPLQRPRGLAVRGDRLFVAEEGEGVVIFDLADAVKPKRLGILPLPGVKALALSEFELHARTPDGVRKFRIDKLVGEGVQTVVQPDK